MGIELWFLGQSGFRVREAHGQMTLFIDPFLSHHDEQTWQAPIQPDALAQADAVLCTHEHIDHFDQPALKAANETPGARFQLVVPEPIVEMALKLGIPRARVTGMQPGQAIQLAKARVHAVPAKHGVNMKDAYSFGKELSNGLVRFLGYVVEMGGVRLYHAGDCIPYDGQIEILRGLHPQLALLPINGRDYFRETERDLVGNMLPREAVQLSHDIGAQVLVPMHWDIFEQNRGFPDMIVQYAEKYFPTTTVLILGRAAKFTFEASEST